MTSVKVMTRLIDTTPKGAESRAVAGVRPSFRRERARHAMASPRLSYQITLSGYVDECRMTWLVTEVREGKRGENQQKMSGTDDALVEFRMGSERECLFSQNEETDGTARQSADELRSRQATRAWTNVEDATTRPPSLTRHDDDVSHTI